MEIRVTRRIIKPMLSPAQREAMRGTNGWTWVKVKEVKTGELFRYDIDVYGEDMTATRITSAPAGTFKYSGSFSEFAKNRTFEDHWLEHLQLVIGEKVKGDVHILYSFPDQKKVEVKR